MESPSICIPAFNEERTICKTLDAVLLAAKKAAASEVLVCANACRDNTAGVIMEWAKRNGLSFFRGGIDNGPLAKADNDAFVKLFETGKPGKPNAWNELRRRARGETLIFMDADVVVEPEAFSILCLRLKERTLKAVGGVALAPPGGNLLSRRLAIKMKEFASKPAPYLNGPLYAIRKDAVESIPEGLIADDAFLTMRVGPENIEKLGSAIAYQAPPSTYPDYYKRRLRDFLADMQMRSLFGETYTEFRKKTRDTRTKAERNAALSFSERAFKAVTAPNTWLLKLIDGLARKRALQLFKKGEVRWYTIPSTKKG